MEYKVYKNVLGSSNELKITKMEYENIKKAKDILFHSLAIEELIDHIFGNYVEWESELAHTSINHMVYSAAYEIIDRKRLLTRKLVNLLTTCRMYIDQVQSIGNKISSEDLKLLFSEQYDANISYRIMEALRNYAQHSGLPLHTLTYNSWREGVYDNDKLFFSTIPKLDPKYLLEDKNFKRTVANEIKNEKEINISFALKEYISSLFIVHSKIRENIKEQVDQAANTFQTQI